MGFKLQFIRSNINHKKLTVCLHGKYIPSGIIYVLFLLVWWKTNLILLHCMNIFFLSYTENFEPLDLLFISRKIPPKSESDVNFVYPDVKFLWNKNHEKWNFFLTDIHFVTVISLEKSLVNRFFVCLGIFFFVRCCSKNSYTWNEIK